MTVNPSSLDKMIRSANRGKRLLRLRYNERVRKVEPHDYGVQKGTARLLAYQLRGAPPAPGRSTTGWRLLDLPKIEDCEVLKKYFAGSRGHLHRERMNWDVLYARVS
jgi:hypothetical protein